MTCENELVSPFLPFQNTSLSDFGILQFDVKRICVLKILDLRFEPPIKEGVVNRFPVWKQYNSQISAVHFCDQRPAPNTPVLLNRLFNRMIGDLLNPFVANDRAIRALTDRSEILGALHSHRVDNARL